MELDPKEREAISVEELKEMELETAVSIQKYVLCFWPKKGEVSKEIQDPNRKNNFT